MNIAINGTCINAVESGAKNRFQSIYDNLIASSPSIKVVSPFRSSFSKGSI